MWSLQIERHGQGIPKFLELCGAALLDWGTADPYEHAPPYVVYHAEFRRSMSNIASNTKENPSQKLGHRARPLKVTQGRRK